MRMVSPFGASGFDGVVESIGKAVDAVGILIVVVGSVAALLPYVIGLAAGRRSEEAYRRVRRTLGRAILLGLEFLVAGDIIRTVAATPTFAGVGVLAIIVLIRTFLSMTLELEVTGTWPWRRASADARQV
jgi:uncharacterized membrane protein